MTRLLSFLFFLAVSAGVSYFLSRSPTPSLRQLTTPSTTIDALINEPSRYDGTTVKVAGTVVGSLGVMGLGGFRLQDPQSGSEILVMTSRGIPSNGAAVTIYGKFKQAMAVGTYQYAVIFKQD